MAGSGFPWYNICVVVPDGVFRFRPSRSRWGRLCAPWLCVEVRPQITLKIISDVRLTCEVMRGAVVVRERRSE